MASDVMGASAINADSSNSNNASSDTVPLYTSSSTTGKMHELQLIHDLQRPSHLVGQRKDGQVQ